MNFSSNKITRLRLGVSLSGVSACFTSARTRVQSPIPKKKLPRMGDKQKAVYLKPVMVAHPVISALGMLIEVGGSLRVQGQPGLLEFWASLNSIARPCWEKEKKGQSPMEKVAKQTKRVDCKTLPPPALLFSRIFSVFQTLFHFPCVGPFNTLIMES